MDVKKKTVTLGEFWSNAIEYGAIVDIGHEREKLTIPDGL
jgi:hypothetical protein